MMLAGRWGYLDGSDTRPVPKDPDNPMDTEKSDGRQWVRDDTIAQCLLSQRLPDELAMDMEKYPTVKEQWDVISALFAAKSEYAKTDLRQAFLNMRCPKGGNVREFLTTLKKKRHKLKAAGVTVTEPEYESTILQGIPDTLAVYAAQTLSTLRLATKYTGKAIDMSDIIDSVCEEADHMKMRRALKEQNAPKGKKGQTDKALAASSSSYCQNNNNANKRRKGKCHHCSREGHWVRECRTKKKEEAAAASSNQNGQTAQATSGSSKSENWPVGSVNAVLDDDSDSDGFCAAKEEGTIARPICTDPDPYLDDSDLDDDWDDVHAEVESIGDQSDKLESLGERPNKLENEGEDPDKLDNEGEDLDIEETAAAVIAPIDADGTPRTEVYDSGSSRHISPYKDDFTSYTPLSTPLYFNAASQHKFPAISTGTLVVCTPNSGRESSLALLRALYVPQVSYTLVSLGALDEEGFMTLIGNGRLRITSPRGDSVAEIPRNARHLYKVIHIPESAHAAELVSAMELHRRLGHISVASARKLVQSGAVKGIKLDPDAPEMDCEACIYARATRVPMSKPRISVPAQSFGDEVHTDVWGPASTSTVKGRRYFITFTDDVTCYTVVYLLKTKDQVLKSYKSYEAWAIAQQHCTSIKVLCSNRGGKYLSKAFDEHLAAAGTARHLTTHDTPQLNGIAERLNRTLLEHVHALRHEAGLPKMLWGEALRHATWLKNRTATRVLDTKTPSEALFGTPPDLSVAHLWGCKVWVHDDTGSKLDARAREGRWLGFDVDSQAHRVYWPQSTTVSVKRNVYFASAGPLEGEELRIDPIGSKQTAALDTPSTSTSPLPPSSPTMSSPSQALEPDSLPVLLRRSMRIPKPSRIIRELQDGVGYSGDDDPEEAGGVWTVEDGAPALLEDFDGMEFVFATETADAEALEPRTLAEAKRRPDWPHWEKAIEEELATLKAAGTWRLEEAPPGANVIGSKWVLKAKKDAAGNIVRYKARLVAQGFSQIGGVDYDDTYAPVAKLASTRAVIAMANRLGFEMHQIDIKGAYLNGKLQDNEVLYMQHPPGYKSPDAGTRVLRLVKTLYGLKQSGRRWYQKLSSVFKSLGFTQCGVDQAVYFKVVVTKGELTVVVVHVDDCTIVANTIRLINELKAGLSKHFEVTDLGELHWMLGIEVKRDRPGRLVHLSQHAYIDTILRRYNLADLKPLSTPMDHQVHLSSDQAPASAAECAMMRDVPYREAVGALNWAALATRPDIAFAVATVARFAANPGPAHWDAVKRIFCYLSGTRELWLTYGEASSPLEGYADADGSMAEDRHAISGYAFLIDGGAVSWSSKRQEIVSLSTTKSEYVAATHGGKEALWLRSLILEVFGDITSPTTLFSDNQAAIALTRDHQYHPRTKHIDVRYHWICWVVEKGSIRLVYCPTDDMVADALTKALPSAKVKHFATSLGLRVK